MNHPPPAGEQHDHHHHDHGHEHHHGDHDHDHPHHHHEHAHRGWRPFWTVFWLILLAVAVGLAVRTVFFVDETEYAYVTQFGRPVRLYTEPGLGVKWPYQSLWRFDRRLRLYEPPAREMLTKDKENLNFGWFVCWRIPGPEFIADEYRRAERTADAEPPDDWLRDQTESHVQQFLRAVGTIPAAESRLEERIQAAVAAEIGNTRLEQLVSLEPGKCQLEQIAQRVTDNIRKVAAEQFGIEVVDVRLKRFNYPEAVKPAVYAEIRSDRERVAVQYRAEGASEKAKLESLAELQRSQLLAQARREASAVRGAGEAKAMQILNAAHGKNPQFYELLKTLESYRTILDDQTTVILSADSPLLRLLTRGLPEPTK